MLKMKTIYLLSRFAAHGAMVVLGFMMLLTVSDVFLRYFFNSPISGSTEVTEFMMVIVVFPAFAYCALKRRHVGVDILLSHFPRRLQTIIDTITLLAALGIYIIITWQSFLEAMDMQKNTPILNLPHFPFYWVLTFCFALFCFSIAVVIIENIEKEAKR
jgi:TRAP-type C4-dicarboxylate transport system permease small subunit